MDYQAVWWRLFNCPCSGKWKNCSSFIELLFSLLASNGKLERILSQLITINTDKQSLLNNDQLDYLLSLNADAIPLKTIDANPSIDLWWQDKRWRLIQRQRKPDKKERKPFQNLAALQWLITYSVLTHQKVILNYHQIVTGTIMKRALLKVV